MNFSSLPCVLHVPPIVQYKQNWLNHFSRMEDIRYPKQLFDSGPVGRRRPGRPLDYWTNTVVRPKQVIYWLNFVTRRRPGRPLKRLLDGYSLEAETGHLLTQLHDQKRPWPLKETTRQIQRWGLNNSFIDPTQWPEKTCMSIRETAGRIQSWGRNRSLTGLTLWPEEELKHSEIYVTKVLCVCFLYTALQK
jgi:hypothetical protein